MKFLAVLLGLVAYSQCAVGFQAQLGSDGGPPVAVYKIWSGPSQAVPPSAAVSSEKSKRHYYIQQQNVIVCYPGSNEASCKNLFSTIPGYQTLGGNLHQPAQQYPQSSHQFPEKPIQSYRQPEQSLNLPQSAYAPAHTGPVASTIQHVPQPNHPTSSDSYKLSTPVVCIQGSNQQGCISPSPSGAAPEAPFSYFEQAVKPGQAAHSAGCSSRGCNNPVSHHTPSPSNEGLELGAFGSSSSVTVGPIQPLDLGFNKPTCYPGSRLPGCNLKTPGSSPFIQEESNQIQLPKHQFYNSGASSSVTVGPIQPFDLGFNKPTCYPGSRLPGCNLKTPSSSPFIQEEPNQIQLSNQQLPVPSQSYQQNFGNHESQFSGSQHTYQHNPPIVCTPGTVGCGESRPANNQAVPAKPHPSYGSSASNVPIVCVLGSAGCNPGHSQPAQVPPTCLPGSPGCSGSNYQTTTAKPTHNQGYSGQKGPNTPIVCTAGSPGCTFTKPEKPNYGYSSKQNGQALPVACNSNTPGCVGSSILLSAAQANPTNGHGEQSYQTGSSNCKPGTSGCGGKYQNQNVKPSNSNGYPAQHGQSAHSGCAPGSPGCQTNPPSTYQTTTLKPTNSYHNMGSSSQKPIACTPGSQGCDSYSKPATHPVISGVCNPGAPGCQILTSASSPGSNAQGTSAWIASGPLPCTPGDNQPGCQVSNPFSDTLPATEIAVPIVCADREGKGCSNPFADNTLPPPVLCSGGFHTAGCAILPPDVTPVPLNPTTISAAPYNNLLG